MIFVGVFVALVALGAAEARPNEGRNYGAGLPSVLPAPIGGGDYGDYGGVDVLPLPPPPPPPFGGGGGGVGGGYGGKCRYWCKDPSGRYGCCETREQGAKPGRCPIVRALCPRFSPSLQPPQPCATDNNCAGADKCCHDRCLRESVCKQPLQLY